MNPEQLRVLETVKTGKNVLITGGAGVGKSYTVEKIVEWASSKKFIGVCAMTGCAALLINGSTLHSYLGIGLAQEPALTLAHKAYKYPTVRERIQDLEILLVDEVSMMSSELFEKVEEFLRLVRKSKKPFGGVQIIFVGDPFQLCPVSGNYFFDCELWKNSNFVVEVLSINMRQQGDLKFKELLDRVRYGVCNHEDLATLQSLKTTVFPETIKPTRLYSKNVSVDSINQKELLALKQPLEEYHLEYSNEASMKWAKSNRIPESVQVCVGAQVMCTKNLPELGLVNGSRGVILEITPGYVKVEVLDGRTVMIAPISVKDRDKPWIEVKYLPLKLAWAVTIHTSQGMTLDALEVDLGRDIFTWGQAYTGLSRARSLDSIRVISVVPESFVTHQKVLDFFSFKR
jgi:ATP-dependent DNA helicase PIF1